MGTLSVLVAVIWMRGYPPAALRHLRDLGVEALAHLGAAVVQVDRTVGVDVDQRHLRKVAVKLIPNFTGVLDLSSILGSWH